MALLNSTSRPDHFIFYVPAFCALVDLWRTQFVSLWDRLGTGISVALIAFTAQFVVGSRELNNQLELWRVPVIGMIVLCVVLTKVVVSERKGLAAS